MKSITVRGYDTAELFREDILERIRHLEAEIKDHQKKIREIERQLPASEQSRKKGLEESRES